MASKKLKYIPKRLPKSQPKPKVKRIKRMPRR